MIALAFLLGASVVALAATTVTFAVLSRRDANHLASVQIAQAHSEGEQARLAYELEVTTHALKAANARAAALEEIVAHDVNAPVASDLPASAWRERMLRITQVWGNAAADHPASDTGTVPEKPATDAPKSDGEAF
jgi:hypothetical protein